MRRARVSRGLLGAFAISLVAVGLRETWEARGDSDFGGARNQERLFPQLAADEVQRLRVRLDDRTDELERDIGGAWRVVGRDGRAHSPTVDGLLQTLVELVEGRVVTEDLAAERRFGFGERSGLRVEAWDAAEQLVADVHFGSVAARGSFYRRDGEEVIRRVKEDLAPALRPRRLQTFGWRDDTVIGLGEGASVDVVALEIRGPEGLLSFERADPEGGEPVWRMRSPEEGPVLSWRCQLMAQVLSELRADAFHDGPETAGELGLDPPDWIVSALRRDGSTTVLHLGSAVRDNTLPVTLPGAEEIWWIPAFRGQSFQQGASAYRSER